MPIVRCPVCSSVALDTAVQGSHTVACAGCGSRQQIVIEDARLKSVEVFAESGTESKCVSQQIGEKVVRSFDTIIYEKEDKVARIIFNRPEKLNAINAAMIRDLIAAIDEVEKDDDICVAIMKGAGRAFSAGGDMSMVYNTYSGEAVPGDKRRRPSQRARLHTDTIQFDVFRRARQCWKPLICQAQGYCIGFGLMLSHCCDITIASEDAQFGHPEQRLAFGGGVSLEEILLIGLKKARELLITGKLIDGKEAERIGWVNRAVPHDKLEEEVEKLAKSITLMPRDAIAIGKANTLLAMETLGYSASHLDMVIMHSLATNIRFEPDEFNFVRTRGDKGASASFHERDDRYSGVV